MIRDLDATIVGWLSELAPYATTGVLTTFDAAPAETDRPTLALALVDVQEDLAASRTTRPRFARRRAKSSGGSRRRGAIASPTWSPPSRSMRWTNMRSLAPSWPAPRCPASCRKPFSAAP